MLLQRFSSALDKHHMTGGTIVLALSGGVDSRVLLHLLSEYKLQHPENNYLAVHVHHGLSENADDWAEKCHNWCGEQGISLVVERVKLALNAQTSIEQEARDKRYEVLSRFIGKGDTLITGQHLGDQTETFLLALKRGSGPKGLSSMPELMPFSEGYILRPLLGSTQQAICAYASEHGLDWVEDESNQNPKFDRNFLRLEIVPALKSRWPHIEESISRSAGLCADQEALLEELLADKLAGLMSQHYGLSVSGLTKQSELARNQLIRLWLAKSGCLMPSQKQLSMIWHEVAKAREDANPKLVLTSGEIRRFRGELFVTQKYQDVSGWKAPLKPGEKMLLPDELGRLELRTETQRASLRAFKPEEQLWVSFNPEKLSAHPTERNHSRNMKKLFQEYGVPSWLRRRTPILMLDDKVVAVPGLFVDKTFSGNDCELVWEKI